jgi:hypothetical protein
MTSSERASWPVRKFPPGEEPQEEASIAAMTPSERVALVL